MKAEVEGVETWRQREVLNALGCDLMQGFPFSPPSLRKK
jgi:EAL domain-containing protein (putative c-di-GMP-specific phosphodiesterase class I)